VPVLGGHAALPRMSVNTDFSTLVKCLASGKKSIEQLRHSAPRQTSALELLEVYSFRILLVYLCALYNGMLILSRALGACPTPPWVYRRNVPLLVVHTESLTKYGPKGSLHCCVYVALASQYPSRTHNCARLLIVPTQCNHLNCRSRLK